MILLHLLLVAVLQLHQTLLHLLLHHPSHQTAEELKQKMKNLLMEPLLELLGLLKLQIVPQIVQDSWILNQNLLLELRLEAAQRIL